MDHEQFAALTRLVAARGSRRSAALALLGAALFGRAITLVEDAEAKGSGGRDGGKRHGRNRGNGRHRQRRRKDHSRRRKPPTARCAESCAGCCDGDLCITAISDETCGANGSPCVQCSATQTCGGGGEPGVCGGGSCTPLNCAEQGIECGSATDGCGETLECGDCTEPGETCGRCSPGVCGAPLACTPQKCADLEATCGPQSDGCGGVIQCGSCTAPAFCGGAGPSRCGESGSGGGPPTCTPRSCAALGVTCGPAGDGCGGLLNCGPCPTGRVCLRNRCRSVC